MAQLDSPRIFSSLREKAASVRVLLEIMFEDLTKQEAAEVAESIMRSDMDQRFAEGSYDRFMQMRYVVLETTEDDCVATLDLYAFYLILDANDLLHTIMLPPRQA